MIGDAIKYEPAWVAAKSRARKSLDRTNAVDCLKSVTAGLNTKSLSRLQKNLEVQRQNSRSQQSAGMFDGRALSTSPFLTNATQPILSPKDTEQNEVPVLNDPSEMSKKNDAASQKYSLSKDEATLSKSIETKPQSVAEAEEV